ncbi:hypothetical protein D9M72_581510 [compost metagenome]
MFVVVCWFENSFVFEAVSYTSENRMVLTSVFNSVLVVISSVHVSKYKGIPFAVKPLSVQFLGGFFSSTVLIPIVSFLPLLLMNR